MAIGAHGARSLCGNVICGNVEIRDGGDRRAGYTAAVRVPFSDVCAVLRQRLITRGMTEAQAQTCAMLFANASADGVPSHGLNRFPRFLRMIDNGSIDVRAEPVLRQAAGALER